MKTKTVVKCLLDASMTVIYGLLMFDLGTGAFFHEVAGIAIGVLFLFHLILNWSTGFGLWRSVRKGIGSLKNKFLLTLDCLLPGGMLIVIVTGVLISRALFSFQLENQLLIYQIHNAAAYLCLAILLLHLALHTKYLLAVLRQMGRHSSMVGVRKAVSGFAIAALIIGFVYVNALQAYQNDVLAAVLLPTAAVQSSSVDAVKPSAAQTAGTVVAETAETAAEAKKKEEEAAAANSSAAQGNEATVTPTLADFLGKIVCTGCHNRCLLSNPRCGIGAQQAEIAEVEYDRTYGITG